MLYKKIHRQYLREFRIGRKYKGKYTGKVYEIAVKPYITKEYIQIGGWWLINFYSGELYNKDVFEWLED